MEDYIELIRLWSKYTKGIWKSYTYIGSFVDHCKSGTFFYHVIDKQTLN